MSHGVKKPWAAGAGQGDHSLTSQALCRASPCLGKHAPDFKLKVKALFLNGWIFCVVFLFSLPISNPEKNLPCLLSARVQLWCGPVPEERDSGRRGVNAPLLKTTFRLLFNITFSQLLNSCSMRGYSYASRRGMTGAYPAAGLGLRLLRHTHTQVTAVLVRHALQKPVCPTWKVKPLFCGKISCASYHYYCQSALENSTGMPERGSIASSSFEIIQGTEILAST